MLLLLIWLFSYTSFPSGKFLLLKAILDQERRGFTTLLVRLDEDDEDVVSCVVADDALLFLCSMDDVRFCKSFFLLIQIKNTKIKIKHIFKGKTKSFRSSLVLKGFMVGLEDGVELMSLAETEEERKNSLQ